MKKLVFVSLILLSALNVSATQNVEIAKEAAINKILELGEVLNESYVLSNASEAKMAKSMVESSMTASFNLCAANFSNSTCQNGYSQAFESIKSDEVTYGWQISSEELNFIEATTKSLLGMNSNDVKLAQELAINKVITLGANLNENYSISNKSEAKMAETMITSSLEALYSVCTKSLTKTTCTEGFEKAFKEIESNEETYGWKISSEELNFIKSIFSYGVER